DDATIPIVLAVAAEMNVGAAFATVTVIPASFLSDSPPPSATATMISYLSLHPPPPIYSKFGEVLNVTAPVDESTLNSAASAPPEMEEVTVVLRALVSGALAVPADTDVACDTLSGVLAVAAEVIVGASLSSVTVFATALL